VPIQSWRDGLFDVLTSGPIPDNPSELLRSIDLTLREFESRYDVILVDSPALLPVADGSVLARACDGALLVVRHGRTPGSDVTDALAALRAVSARVLGCAFSMEPKPNRTFRRSQPSPVPDVTNSTVSSQASTKPGPGAETTMANQSPVAKRGPTVAIGDGSQNGDLLPWSIER
jgi:polysaccharide biosynthesis transport protein